MPTREPDAELTLAEAEAMQREAIAADVWLPGVLVADALEPLQAMMPQGLTRRLRAPIDPPGVVETWD